MSDDFNCEFADVCDFVCFATAGCATSGCETVGCVNDTVCPFYKEVKI